MLYILYMGIGTGVATGASPPPPTLEEQSISFAIPLGAAYKACSDSELLVHGPFL